MKVRRPVVCSEEERMERSVLFRMLKKEDLGSVVACSPVTDTDGQLSRATNAPG